MFPGPVCGGGSSCVRYCESLHPSGISHWRSRNSQCFWGLELENQKSVVSKVLYNK